MKRIADKMPLIALAAVLLSGCACIKALGENELSPPNVNLDVTGHGVITSTATFSHGPLSDFIIRQNYPAKVLVIPSKPKDEFMHMELDGKVIGALIIKNGKLSFRGEAWKSAQVFFDALSQVYTLRCDEL